MCVLPKTTTTNLYHHSDKQGNSANPEYAPYKVELTRKYHDLSCDTIFELENSQRTEAAKMAICQAFRAAEHFLTIFYGDQGNSFILVGTRPYPEFFVVFTS